MKQKLLSLTCICFLARLVRPSYLILIVLGLVLYPFYKEKEAATPLPLLARNALASAKTTSTAATLDDVLDDNILDDLV